MGIAAFWLFVMGTASPRAFVVRLSRSASAAEFAD